MSEFVLKTMRQISHLAIFSLLVLVHTGWGNPVLLAGSSVRADTSDHCPSGFSQPSGSNWTTCYKAYNGLYTKDKAEKHCAKDNATLASVPNAFVNSYLYQLTYSSGYTAAWLGVECKNGDRSTCRNDDFTKLVYTNFCKGYPSSAGDCVQMPGYGGIQCWYSFDCTSQLPMICEAPVKKRGAPRCPSGYDSFNGTCYKFVSTKSLITADNAASYCAQTPGGILAIIANAQVNQYLMSQIYTGNSYTAFGLECPKVKQDGDRRSCYWIDGTPFSYQAFYDGNTPAAQPGGGCCDFNKGKWADCWPCNASKYDSYICQAPMQ